VHTGTKSLATLEADGTISVTRTRGNGGASDIITVNWEHERWRRSGGGR